MSGQTIVVLIGAAAGLLLLWSWVAGARTGRKVAQSLHSAGRRGNNAVRVLATAIVIVVVQWAVISYSRDPAAWAVVLGVPALIAGVTVARMLAGPDQLVRVSGRGMR